MPRSMASVDYVYTPTPPEVRAKMAAAHRRRLGIPEGHVRIHGIHVPQEHEWPLRYYASWVRSRFGIEAAVSLIHEAIESGFDIAKPSPTKRRRDHPDYCPQPLSAEVRKKIGDGVRRQFASVEEGKFDWALLNELMGEGMTIEDVAQYLRVGERYLSRTLTNRRRAKRRGEL